MLSRKSSLPSAGRRACCSWSARCWPSCPGAGRLACRAISCRLVAGQRRRRPAVPHGGHLDRVYGVIIAGWASNSKVRLSRGRHAFGGADGVLRIADGLCPGRLMVSGSLNLVEIVSAIRASPGVGVLLELAAAAADVPGLPDLRLAETNRAPFDVAEGESEIVAGFMSNTRAWRSRCSSWPNTPT